MAYQKNATSGKIMKKNLLSYEMFDESKIRLLIKEETKVPIISHFACYFFGVCQKESSKYLSDD